MTAKRTRLSRWLRRALYVLVGGPLAYLALLNGLLNSGLIPGLLSQQPQVVQVSYRSAWALWPGEVHVTGFTLRNQDPKAQFELFIDQATTAVVVSALFERRFQTGWVKASGVEFRLRPLLADDEDAAELTRFFPVIKGFAEPPSTLPVGDTWAVQLENVAVTGVREVWIGSYRAELDADVKGRFWLKRDHSLSVGPATIAIHRAAVFQGPTPAASNLAGSATGKIDLKNVLEDEGALVWQSIDWKVDVQGQLDSLAFLAHHLGQVPGLKVEGGKTRVKVAASTLRGVLLEGSQLDLDGEEAIVHLGNYRFRGTWSAHGQVKSRDGKRWSTLEASLSPVQIETQAGDKLVHSAGVKAALSASDLVLGSAPEDGKLSLELVPTAPFGLALLNSFAKSEQFEIDSGRATVGARLSFSPKGKSGSLAFKTGLAQVRIGRSRARGEAIVDLDLARMRFGRGSVDLSGSAVEFNDVAVISSRARPRGWGGKLFLDAAHLTVRPELSGTAEFSGTFTDALPFLALFGDAAGLPRWTTGLLEAAGLQVRGSLGFLGSRLTLRNLVATGEGLEIRGLLDVTATQVSGLFLLKVQGFAIGLDITPEAVVAQLENPSVWYAKQLAAWKH